MEKWIVHPGETRVIDLESLRELKIGLVGGQVDVIAHDEATARIEVHGVTVKDLRIEMVDGRLEIDHPQLRWDNFLEVFRNFGAGGPKAEVSVAVPRAVALTLGVVSASALVSGLRTDAKLNTVSGDIIVDGLVGDVNVNAVSGDVQVRELEGALSANSVSGDITVTGAVTKASIDTVSGAMLVDSTGPVQAIALNSVNGAATIRLDRGLPANYVSRSVSGRVQIDGHVRSGSGPTSYSGSTGTLAGSFVDVRANTVSGEITVLRRGISGLRPEELATEEEW
ncbi:MAG: hypothetical protein K0S37_2904 [Microbacterium sp.]|jgi:hypothetical protein|nr:hypothetical protein [Microbacterium sp.]